MNLKQVFKPREIELFEKALAETNAYISQKLAEIDKTAISIQNKMHAMKVALDRYIAMVKNNGNGKAKK